MSISLDTPFKRPQNEHIMRTDTSPYPIKVAKPTGQGTPGQIAAAAHARASRKPTDRQAEVMVGPNKVSNWMMALSDFMIACPNATGRDASNFFNRTQAWISTVKSSNAFREFHSLRRKEHFDEISKTMSEKLTTLGEMSVDALVEKVEEEGNAMTVSQLTECGKMALGALGFGGKTASVQINNNDNRQLVVADNAALKKSQKILEQLRERNDAQISADRSVEGEYQALPAS